MVLQPGILCPFLPVFIYLGSCTRQLLGVDASGLVGNSSDTTLDYLRELLHLPKTPESREPNVEQLPTREILHVRAVLTSYMLSPVIMRKGSVSSNRAGHLLDVIALFHISERKLGCTMLFHLFRILFYSFQKTSLSTHFHSPSVWMCFYHVCMCAACR